MADGTRETVVANLEMHGQGTFYDPQLNDADKFPIAALNGFGNVRPVQDRITAKLPTFGLGLSDAQKADLVQYLKSL